MRVYVLHLASPAGMTQAFDLVLSDQDVASCMVESELLRVRFLAPPKHADALAERIYQAGELLWCSRHDLAQVRQD